MSGAGFVSPFFASSGSVIVGFAGSMFGMISLTPSVAIVPSSFISSSVCEFSFWNSHSSLSVKISKSDGTPYFAQLLLSMALVKSSFVGVFSYQLGAITRLSPSSFALNTGGQTIGIFGSGIGALSPSIRTLQSASEISSWISDSATSTKIPILLRNSIQIITLTVASRSVSTALFPSSPAILSWSLVDSCPTSTPPEISITGSFFGTHDSTVTIRLAASSLRTNRWVSDSSILGKPKYVELTSHGIVVSVNNAITSVPFGYICSNLAQNEPGILLSSQFVSDRDVTMTILFTPFAGIRERGSLVLTLTGGKFSFPPASPVFLASLNEPPMILTGTAYNSYTQNMNVVRIFFLRVFNPGFSLALLIPGVTNPNHPQAEQQNITAASFGTYGVTAGSGGGFSEGRNNGTLQSIKPKSSLKLIIQLASRSVRDRNVFNIILTPDNGLSSPGFLHITLVGGQFGSFSDAIARISSSSISAKARIDSNVLKFEFSSGVSILSGIQFAITLTNVQNPIDPQDERFDICAAITSASGLITDSTTTGYLPAIYGEVPAVWTAGKITSFVVNHDYSSFFDSIITLSDSNTLDVLSVERLNVNQSLFRAAINTQGEYLVQLITIAPGALECLVFFDEWRLPPPISRWLQPTLSTEIGGMLVPFDASVSVRWTGYVVSFQSVDITFTVVTNRKFRFWIAQELLMQQQSGSGATVKVYASIKSMTRYKHENLTIEFQRNENTEITKLNVQWESSYWSKQDIPTANLWNVVHENYASPIAIKVMSASISPSSSFSCISMLTAGIPSLLVVHSRDAYGNVDANIADDSSKMIHIGWSSPQNFFRTPVTTVDASSTGIQIITVSGTYQLTVLLPSLPGNLIATVYSDSFFNRPIRNELRVIDFSSADMASYPVSGKEAFGLRWSGLFKPTKSAVYTFQGCLHTDVTIFEDLISNRDDSDEVFALYLDGIFVAGNKGPNSTTIVRLPLSGTIQLIQDLFYLIQVEYSSIRSANFQTSKRLTLQMFQDGSPRGIPSESLFISEHLRGSPKTVTVHPSSHLCASVSTQTFSPGTIVTAGDYSALSLQARDVFGNPLSVESISNHYLTAVFVDQKAEQPRFVYTSSVGNISIGFILMKKGTFNVQLFARGVPIYQAFYISVVPDFPEFSSISFFGEVPEYATAGIYFQQAVAIFDSFGNMRSFLEKAQDFSQNIRLTSNISSDNFNYTVTLCRSTTECGSFGASGTSIFAGEVALLSAVFTLSGGISFKCGFNFLEISPEIWSQPSSMTVLPAAVCAAKSLVLGSGLTIVTIGTTSCVTILSRDAYSNPQNAIWIINITSSTSSTSLIAHSRQVSAFASLVLCYPPNFGVSQVGNVSVFVSQTIQDVPRLIGAPKPLSYASNVICAAKCVITGSGLCVATAGEVASFTIQSHDEIGGQIDISPELLFVLVKTNDVIGMGSSLCQIGHDRAIFASLQLISNASAVVAYVNNWAGPIVLQGALLQPGGLSMQVFESPLLHESSIIAEIEPAIYSAVDVHFGSGLIDISFAKFYSTTTMIVWKGFLVPQFTESYTFQLESNGCTNVNISGKMLFTCSNTMTNSLKLRGNELHSVEVSYRHLNGEPSLVLLWQSPSQLREIIPFGRWIFASCPASFLLNVTVNPSSACATYSRLSGSGQSSLVLTLKLGLTVATSGLIASFRIQFRDSFGNQFTKSLSATSVAVFASDHGSVIPSYFFSRNMTSFDSNSSLNALVSYYSERMGDTSIRVMLLAAVGACATYYSDGSFLSHEPIPTYSVIGTSLGNMTRFSPTWISVVAGTSAWSALYSPLSLNSFFWIVSSGVESIRFFVSNIALLDINFADSISSTLVSAPHIFSDLNAMYEIKLEYRSMPEASFVNLRVGSDFSSSVPLPSLSMRCYSEIPNNELLSVQPAAACTTKSTLSVASIMTAGIPSVASLQVIDEFFNSRMNVASWFAAICYSSADFCYDQPALSAFTECCNYVGYNINGSLSMSLSKSGSARVVAEMPCNSSVTQLSVSDRNCSSLKLTFANGSAIFSLGQSGSNCSLFKGFLQFSAAGSHFVTLTTSDGTIPSMWIGSQGASARLNFNSSGIARVLINPASLFNTIDVEWSPKNLTAFMSMILASAEFTVQTVNASSLTFRCQLPAVSVKVLSGETCAANSIVSDVKLVNIAGTLVTIGIVSRDAFGNTNNPMSSFWFASAKFIHPGGSLGKDIFFAANLQSNAPSLFSLMMTRSGSYRVDMIKAEGNGLQSYYYENLEPGIQGASDYFAYDIQYSTNFQWNSSSLSSKKKLFGSVRVIGWISLPVDDTISMRVESDGRYKVTVGEDLHIECWSPNENCAAEITKTNAIWRRQVRGSLYPITIDIRPQWASALPYFRLVWFSMSMPVSDIAIDNLWASWTGIFSPTLLVTIEPGTISAASALILTDTSFSIATAGVLSCFSISSVDTFGNAASIGYGNSLDALRWMISGRANGLPVALSYAVHPNNPDQEHHHLTIVSTQASSVSLFASYADMSQTGLWATMYASSSFESATVSFFLSGQLRYTSFRALLAASIPSSLSLPSVINVRMASAFQPASTLLHKFEVETNSSQSLQIQYLNVTINHNQAASLNSSLPAIYVTPINSAFIRIVIFMTFTNEGTFGLLFSLPQQSSQYIIPYPSIDVDQPSVQWRVYPSVAYLSSKALRGAGLSIATAGIPSVLFVSAVDEYGNVRPKFDSGWRVYCSIRSNNLSTSWLGTLASPNMVAVQYMVSRSGSYILSVKLGLNILNSELLVVGEGAVCAGRTSVAGNALSIGTAGASATFSVIFRDAYEQILSTALENIFVQVYSSDFTEKHTLGVKYISNKTGLEHYFSHIVSFRTTRTGSFFIQVQVAENIGLSARYRLSALQPAEIVGWKYEMAIFQCSGGTVAPHGMNEFLPSYSGFIRSVTSGLYTFQFSSIRNIERFVLIIDDQRIFDTQVLSSAVVSATIALGTETLYSLWIELSSVSTLDYLCLQWAYGNFSFSAIPSSNLFSNSKNVSGSPFPLSVFPTTFCASASRAFGFGISLATCAQTTSFFILLKDSFGNNVTYNESIHHLAVLLRYGTKVPMFRKSLTQGSVQRFADSIAVASYRTFVVRNEIESPSDAFGQWQEMIITSIEAGYLIATYFSLSGGGVRVNTTTMASNAFDYNSIFLVRFSGFFVRESREWNFVKVTIPSGSVLRSSTTVLGFKLVADVASNSTHASSVTFDIDSLEIGGLGDVYLEISGNSSSGMSMLRFDYFSETNSSQIPTDKLFARYDIPVNTMYGSGLVATYYTDTTLSPASSFSSTTVEWTTSTQTDRPFGFVSSNDFNILRWNGMLVLSRPSIYTFSALKAREDTVFIVINGLPFLEPSFQATLVTGTIMLAEPLVFEILISHNINSSASSHGFFLYFSCCNDAQVVPVPQSAFKRKMAAYTVDYNDMSSYQWPSGMDLRLSTGSMPMARGLGKIYPATARLLVQPFDEISEGGSSIEAGSMITSAVAGFYSTFKVNVRDYWFNQVFSDPSRNFVASRLVPLFRDPTDGESNPAFMISGENVEQVSEFSSITSGPQKLFYMSTRSGNYLLQTITARTQGMIIVIRPRVSGSDYSAQSSRAYTILRNTSNFSLSDNLDERLIQCSALLKIEESGYVTIYVQANVQFVLWIDGRVLTKASSIDAREWSGEFWSPGFALHNLLLDIENSSSISKRVLMQYSSATVPKQVIPQEVLADSYLFIETSNTFNFKLGPVDIFDFSNFPTKPLVFPQISIQPASVCASLSFVNLSVTTATAGFQTKFLIHALDKYGNQISQNNDCFNSSLYGLDACFFLLNCPDGSTISRGISAFTASLNEFSANIIVTTVGAPFDIRVASALLVQNGGLAATYFCDNKLAVPRASLVESPTLATDAGMYIPAPIYDCLNNGVFSVRWSGFLLCTTEGVATLSASAASSLRIVVSSKEVLKINNGVQLNSSATFASFGLIMDVLIEYISSDARDQFLALDFSCNSTSNAKPSYFFGLPLKPSQQFVVSAGPTCASLSNVWGSGLSIATSGVSNFVRMSFKDTFGNIVDFYNGRNADDIVTASLYPLSIYIWPCRTCPRPLFVPNVPMHCGLCQITKASRLDLPVPQPAASFIPERAGDYKIVVSIGHKYGLTATYYGGCNTISSEVKNIGFPFTFSRSYTQLQDSLPSSFACDAADIKDKISLPVAVRWRGFMVFPRAPLEYRLFAMGDGEYAVWLSSKLLIDKRDGPWSASVFIASDQVAYDIEITYYSNVSNCWFNLGWESLAAVWGSVWPSALHSRHDIPTNGLLDVLSRGSAVVTSIENGTVVSTATAHNFATTSRVIFVVSGFFSFSQTLDCSGIYTVTGVQSSQSFKVSSVVQFPSSGEMTVNYAWYVNLSASAFVTSTPHGLALGDVVAFSDGNGSRGMINVNGGGGNNSVWECLSSIRDYAVASTPTSSSFTLANSTHVLSILNFSCNSSSAFVVRKSLQNRLVVKSGGFCASRSFVMGLNLSLATVGNLFSYPVQLRDSYHNLVAVQNAALISVNVFDSLTNSSVDYLKASIFTNEGYPTVFISTTVSGFYKVSVFDISNGANLDNSPVLVRVNPHTYCAAASSMQPIMTSIIMNWASRMEFYARDSFGNMLTDTLAGYTPRISSCMPDAGFATPSITSKGSLRVSFSTSSRPCTCCANLYLSLSSGPIYNGNGTTSILTSENDNAGVLSGLRILREGSNYVAVPTVALLSYPLFVVKMVLVNGSESLTIVLAYTDVKISDNTYSVLHSFPKNPGRGRVLTLGLALLHGGLLATYYALDAQVPLAPGTSVFSSSSWTMKLTPCLVGVMGKGVTLNTTSCRANSTAAAVKFSGIVHREGKMAPLIMFMAVHNGTLLNIFFASRSVIDASIVSGGEQRLLFYSAVVPMVPSNYQKILTDFYVEYAGAPIPSFSFPLFAGTACSQVLAISSITATTIGMNMTFNTTFYTSRAHGYSANSTVVRLFGSLPSPLSQSILYQVSSVWTPSAFSLSILGDSASLSNVSTVSYAGSSGFVEEVHGACGVRAPFELGSAYVRVALV